MPHKSLTINVAYDPEAKIWYTEESPDLFGVIAYGHSLEELRQVLPGVILDMIEDNKPEWLGHNIAVEIVATARERIDIAA
jgi:predicted RNase H-like HicB family nuclease